MLTGLDAVRRIFARAALASVLAAPFAGPAVADFHVCNNTSSRTGVAIGYKDKDSWTTEGWWNLPPGGCETILRGP